MGGTSSLFGGIARRSRVGGSVREVTRVRPDTEVDPASVGVDPAALRSAWGAIASLYRSGMHPAISICLRRRGEVLLDRSIGHAAGNDPGDPPGAERVLASPDTPFCLLSASKPVTATVIHLLDERALLHVDDPVCEYLPRFARHGKHGVTIRHLLAHRSGIPNPDPGTIDLDLLGRPDDIIEMLCDARLAWRPGSRVGYQALTTGFLLGEIVRAATGRDLQTVLRDEIRAPLGLGGLAYGVPPSQLARVARNSLTGAMLLPPVSTMFRRALSLDFEQVVEMSNDPRFLTGVLPSANVVANADEACRFMEMLRRGGTLDGTRILERRTVVRAVGEQSWLEPDATLILPMRYGMGFMLGAEWFSLFGPFTPQAFGHVGFTNVIAWADPERELSAALLTSGKPVVYAEIAWVFEVLRRIGSACPRSRRSALPGDGVPD